MRSYIFNNYKHVNIKLNFDVAKLFFIVSSSVLIPNDSMNLYLFCLKLRISLISFVREDKMPEINYKIFIRLIISIFYG